MFLLSILILVAALQSFVLDFFLIGFIGRPCWAFVSLDSLLVVHLILNFQRQNAAFKCALQWMLYCWLLACKLGIYYFAIFAQRLKGLTAADVAEILSLSQSYGFFIIVFLTPIIYVFWFGRVSRPLFGKVSGMVSVESLLFCDLALHVIFDLLDIIIAFQLAASHTYITPDKLWLYNTNGVFMLLGIIFHSFSMPTYSSVLMEHGGRSLGKSATASQLQENDVYLTRKHVALVSMFVMDIPMLIVRLLIYFQLENTQGRFGFNFFLIKNIIDLPLTTFRLNQCRIAEKNQSRTMEKRIIRPSIMTSHLHMTALQDERRVAFAEKGADSPTAVKQSPLVVDTEPQTLKETIIREVVEHQRVIDSFAGNHKTNLMDKLDPVEQTLPVKGFAFAKVARKLADCIASGGRHSIAERLDTGLILPYWRSARLAAPLICYWSTRFIMVGFYSTPTEGYRVDWKLGTADNLPLLILCSVSSGVMILSYIGSAPLFEVLLASVTWFIRNLSFFCTLWVFRDTHLLDLLEAFHQIGVHLPSNIPWEQLAVWGFALHTVFGMLTSLFYVQSAFLSRKFTFFVMQPRNRTARRLAFARREGETQYGPKADEFGWISTASILAYLNCRHRLAPLSFNELLIGPDMIKAVRLSDIMITHDWQHFGILCVLKGFTLLLVSDRGLGLIFALHLILEAIYIVLSQTIRLLALRRFETKALYTDLVEAWRETTDTVNMDSVVNEATNGMLVKGAFSSADIALAARLAREGGKSSIRMDRLTTVAEILQRYRRQAFLTSPGETLPLLRP